MPLTHKGREIKSAMEHEYGEKKGEQVFYASKNKGTITGVDKSCAKTKALHGKAAQIHKRVKANIYLNK